MTSLCYLQYSKLNLDEFQKASTATGHKPFSSTPMSRLWAKLYYHLPATPTPPEVTFPIRSFPYFEEVSVNQLSNSALWIIVQLLVALQILLPFLIPLAF